MKLVLCSFQKQALQWKHLHKAPQQFHGKWNLSVWHTKIQTLRDERVRSDRGVDQNDLELKQECFRTEMAEKETKRVERERILKRDDQ